MELYAEAKGIFIKTEYGTKNYVSLNMSTASENSSNNIVIKQERISPETDNNSHRERSRSTDRRHGSEYQDRGTISKKSNKSESGIWNFSNKRKYKDEYSKDRRRRDDSHSKRKTYHRASDTVTNEGGRHDGNVTEEPSSSKQVGRYNENDGKLYKYGDKYHSDSSKNASRYESSSKERKHRSYREDSSKYDHRRKYDEHERSYKDFNRNREEKHMRHHADQIKEEKKDYREGSNDEGRKRQRH